MRTFLKQYEVRLTTLSPLHIGNGKSYLTKEYIYEDGYYYFPDIFKLYQELESIDYQLAQKFEYEFLDSRSNVRLIDFLKKNKVETREFAGYKIKEHGFENNAKYSKHNINNVDQFIKNAYGKPYVPGSSLKGALRTVIVNQIFTEIRNADKTDVAKELMKNIRVSDSNEVSLDKLTIIQKWQYSTDKNTLTTLNQYREAIKPGVTLKFKVTAEGQNAINVLDKIIPLIKNHYQAYVDYFLQYLDRQDFIQNAQTVVYLGAGNGFWTKVKLNEAKPPRRMKGRGLYRFTKYSPIYLPKKDGGKLRLIRNNENIFEVGKCLVNIKEI